MKSNIYIVTGGSNGFGHALVLNLLEKNQTVISISRSALKIKNINLFQIKTDFSKSFSNKTKLTLKKIISELKDKKFETAVLINNAAIVSPVDRIENLQEKEISRHLQINLSAPIVMTQIFLELFLKTRMNINIVQITSGAAQSPVEGWGLYCSGKAALNMFNQVLALQYVNNPRVKAVGYSPGIMDTNMQKSIRSISQKKFPNVNEFKKYKVEKKLRTTEYVAANLLEVISDFSKIESGQIYRVN